MTLSLRSYIFRPNDETLAMLNQVREEVGLDPPASGDGRLSGGDGDSGGGGGGRGGGGKRIQGVDTLRTDQLVGIHIRRGDKRDLGAKERGEPFSDEQYLTAALALADEVGARGFLLASSEPETLKRLPPLLGPRPTFVMPARYFVQVPEGLTPHQVIEKTKQEGGGNDEGMSQIVQLLLLAECTAFLGTVTSNFGLLVTKLMAFRTPTPAALDLSCEGLASMSSAAAAGDAEVWHLEWSSRDAARCKGHRRHEVVPPRSKK